MIKRLSVTGISVTVIILSFYAYHKYSERYPSTDNAYVTANVIHVAPQLSGQVKQPIFSRYICRER